MREQALAIGSGSGDGNVLAGEDMFSRVSVDRASQVIVEQIRLLVRNGRLTPGDRLPSERDLCARFGVSRVTVREALRVLEASGIVQIRVGARGGAFVTSPTSDRLGAGLADLISLSPITAADATEARMVFELGILPLVVERATEADIEELSELVKAAEKALKDGTYTMSDSAAFHVRVAACTHNPAIEMIVHSFHGPLLLSLQEAQTAAPLMGGRGVREHKQYVEAIRRRDVDEARKVLTAHLKRTESRVKGQRS
jgi:GntR family transcriptional regulator, transcriptional repressor for pyruvate dehydrogenase complex